MLTGQIKLSVFDCEYVCVRLGGGGAFMIVSVYVCVHVDVYMCVCTDINQYYRGHPRTWREFPFSSWPSGIHQRKLWEPRWVTPATLHTRWHSSEKALRTEVSHTSYPAHQVAFRGGMTWVVDCQTRKPYAMLMWVQWPGTASDFITQSPLSVQTLLQCSYIPCVHLCAPTSVLC